MNQRIPVHRHHPHRETIRNGWAMVFQHLIAIGCTFFSAPVLSSLMFIIFLASIGKSLGVRRAYTRMLLKIFEVIENQAQEILRKSLGKIISFVRSFDSMRYIIFSHSDRLMNDHVCWPCMCDMHGLGTVNTTIDFIRTWDFSMLFLESKETKAKKNCFLPIRILWSKWHRMCVGPETHRNRNLIRQQHRQRLFAILSLDVDLDSEVGTKNLSFWSKWHIFSSFVLWLFCVSFGGLFVDLRLAANVPNEI